MSAVDFTSVDFTRCAVNFTVPYLLTKASQAGDDGACSNTGNESIAGHQIYAASDKADSVEARTS